MENKDAIVLRSNEIDLDSHEFLSKTTGERFYQQKIFDDEDTGMTIVKLRYPKGCMVPLHDHNCGHGFYVLKGTLATNEGDLEPGSFIWFKEGSKMYHGATAVEDVEALFFTNKPFDIRFLDL